LPVAISADAVEMLSVEVRTCVTILRSDACMLDKACSRCAASSLPL
jgi:hypothetical protein